jgi:hypothetical protein
LQWPLAPRFLDIYYHLGVMNGFDRAGGWTPVASWEFAPAGRPHLYPPLLHFAMLLFRRLGLSAIDVGRLVDCASWPLLLFSFHALAKRTLSARGAFFALLLFSSVVPVSLYAPTQAAFNLAAVLGIWAFVWRREGRTVLFVLATGLCFYAHSLGGWLCFLTLVLDSLGSAGRRRSLSALACALVLGLPILVHQWRNAAYFSFVRVKELEVYELDLLLMALSAAALLGAACDRLWRERSAGLSWLGGFLPAAFTMQTRFFGGPGLLGPSLLSGQFIDRWLEKVPQRYLRPAASVLIAAIAFAGPALEWDLRSGEREWIAMDRSFTRAITAGQGHFRSNSYSVFFEDHYEEIAEVIREHSGPDDLLWSDFSYLAGILSAMTGRATTTGMLPEVRPYEKRDAMADARLLVWLKTADGKPHPRMAATAGKRGWKLLKETDMAFVFENPSPQASRRRLR